MCNISICVPKQQYMYDLHYSSTFSKFVPNISFCMNTNSYSLYDLHLGFHPTKQLLDLRANKGVWPKKSIQYGPTINASWESCPPWESSSLLENCALSLKLKTCQMLTLGKLFLSCTLPYVRDLALEALHMFLSCMRK